MQRSSPWWVAVSIWLLVLYFMSSRSDLPAAAFTINDKVAHFAYFTLGSAAFFVAFRAGNGSRNPWLVASFTLIFAATVGWLDEWHQTFTPGRSGNDFGDWLADVSGGAFGVIVGGLLFHWIKNGAKDGSQQPNQ